MKSKSKSKRSRPTKPGGEAVPKPAVISDQLETARKEFRVAERHYKDLLRHIKGRLAGQEWLVADAAWKLYRDAQARLLEVAQQEKVVAGAGALLEAPKRAFVPKRITPFALATIAALLSGKTGNATDELPKARQLLVDAAGHLEDCQQQLLARFTDGVSFEEILRSGGKNESPLSKWLPGITTCKGLEKLIRRFCAQRRLPLTPADLTQLEKERTTPVTAAERSRLMNPAGNKLQIEHGEYLVKTKKVSVSELISIRAWRNAKRRGHAP